MSDRDVLLEARGVGRLRGADGGWLLEDVSLSLRAGDRLGLAGPSGGGKTLLLRALALLDPVDTGAILWRGQPVRAADIPNFRRQAIYLHQRPALFEGSVEDNLRLPFTLQVYRNRSFDRARVLGLLASLGRDTTFLAKAHGDLSGGESQVVGLVRVLQLDPTVLLLDEPTAALDPATARAAEALVERWRDQAPAARAYVWVSHDSEQGRRVTARRYRMDAGRLTEE